MVEINIKKYNIIPDWLDISINCSNKKWKKLTKSQEKQILEREIIYNTYKWEAVAGFGGSLTLKCAEWKSFHDVRLKSFKDWS